MSKLRVELPMLCCESGDVIVFDHIEPPGEMWTGYGHRQVTRELTFREGFSLAPVVHVSIRMIDGSAQANLRLDICVHDVTTLGCRVTVKTWSDTKIGRIALSWLAIGQRVGDDEEYWNI